MTRWYGKVLGFIAGWLLTRHPVGGLLGLLLGHAFDADWFRSKRDTPYRVLGVTEDASDAEIEQAYRRMISQYHPDKLVGVADDLRRQAEGKASEINAAYDRIQELRKRPQNDTLPAIASYIHGFYNPTRLHSTLGYLSPNDYARKLKQAA